VLRQRNLTDAWSGPHPNPQSTRSASRYRIWELLASSDDLTKLKRILLLRIAELESRGNSGAASNTDKSPSIQPN
jgi:hypothetical protein